MRNVAHLVVGLVGLVTLGLADVASAQEQLLPSRVVTVTAPFDADQRATVERYVDRWAGELLGGRSPEAVSEGRKRLTEPMNRTVATAPFKDQYSAVVARAISPGVNAEPVLVRLNVMIMAAKLSGDHGLDIASSGLRDQVTVVRYWAAKAIADVLTASQEDVTISAARRTQLGGAVIAVVESETSGRVREQMYESLAAVNIPESRSALMAAMEKRIPDYVTKGLNNDLKAEARGFLRLYMVLATADPAGRQPGQREARRKEIRRLVVLAAKYLQVVGNAMEGGSLGDSVTLIVTDLVVAGEAILKWGIRIYTPNAPYGPPLADPLRANQNTQFLFNIGEWLTRLSEPAISITADEVKIK